MSELKPCPICGKELNIHSPEDWKPTFYDPDSGGDPYSADCDCGFSFCNNSYDYKEFVTALNRRAQPDMENPATENVALTLDELRGMDGEPVWIYRLEDNQGWWIVIKSTERDIATTDYGEYFEFADYGKTWLAYRHKPEGV